MLNYKREDIRVLEEKYNMEIIVEIKSGGLQSEYVIEKFVRTLDEENKLNEPTVSISNVAKEVLEENASLNEAEDDEIVGLLGKKNWKSNVPEDDIINEAEISAQVEDISQQKANNIHKLYNNKFHRRPNNNKKHYHKRKHYKNSNEKSLSA